jgi:hypothetical protein
MGSLCFGLKYERIPERRDLWRFVRRVMVSYPLLAAATIRLQGQLNSQRGGKYSGRTTDYRVQFLPSGSC